VSSEQEAVTGDQLALNFNGYHRKLLTAHRSPLTATAHRSPLTAHYSPLTAQGDL